MYLKQKTFIDMQWNSPGNRDQENQKIETQDDTTETESETETQSNALYFSDYSRIDKSEGEDDDIFRCVENAPVKCTECGSKTRISESRGEVYCPDCGAIMSMDELDFGPDWRGDDNNEDIVHRGGSPITELLHDRGLSTGFNPFESDAKGNSIPHKKQQQLRRLDKWNTRYTSRDNKDRNLKRALGEIQRMGSSLGISESVRETASALYRRAVDDEILIGQSIESMTTSCLYIASRIHSQPRPFEKFYRVSQVSPSKVDSTYRHIIREMNIELEPAKPEQYLNQIFSKLENEIENRSSVEELTKRMLNQARGTGLLNGKNPVACSAGAVYASCLLHEEDITQSMVSNATELSNVTVRNRYRPFIFVVGEKVHTDT